MKNLLRIFIFYQLLTGCMLSVKKVQSTNDYFNITQYMAVKDGLFTNKAGELFFQSVKLNQGNLELIFLKRFLFDQGDGVLGKRLNDVIDKESWNRVNDFLYRDKNNLYCFQSQTMGGFLVHLEGFNLENLIFLGRNGWIPYQKSKNFESLYFSDGHSIYYLCEMLNGADYNSLRLIEDYGSSAEDRNNIYFGSKIQPKQ